jgi:hypothetical protein
VVLLRRVGPQATIADLTADKLRRHAERASNV